MEKYPRGLRGLSANELGRLCDARVRISSFPYGEMAEWLKAAVLKTAGVQASVGSNPTLSSMVVMAKWLTHWIVTPTSWVQFPLITLKKLWCSG